MPAESPTSLPVAADEHAHVAGARRAAAALLAAGQARLEVPAPRGMQDATWRLATARLACPVAPTRARLEAPIRRSRDPPDGGLRQGRPCGGQRAARRTVVLSVLRRTSPRQKRTGTHCLRLKSGPWSAKNGDRGLADCE
jgi:hypothetical protein